MSDQQDPSYIEPPKASKRRRSLIGIDPSNILNHDRCSSQRMRRKSILPRPLVHVCS